MAKKFFPQMSRQCFKKIEIGKISKNPNQPRKIFQQEALEQLAASIRQNGIITPLTVRVTENGYELIAGERRLRAAKMAGLSVVPCYIVETDEVGSSLMALIENLQRRDLDFFEEARSLQRLTQLYGLTQQQAAQKIGKTQSAVANKLRLLRLCPAVMAIIRDSGLTERHARALLRIEDEEAQVEAARHIADKRLNVEQTEQYIERRLAEKKPAAGRKVIVKDVRIFINTIDRAVSTMRKAGIKAKVSRREEGESIIMTVVIPQRRSAAAQAVS